MLLPALVHICHVPALDDNRCQFFDSRFYAVATAFISDDSFFAIGVPDGGDVGSPP